MQRFIIGLVEFMNKYPDFSVTLVRVIHLILGIISIKIIRTKGSLKTIFKETVLTAYFYALVFLSLILFNALLSISTIGSVLSSIGIYNAAGLFGAFAETIWSSISNESVQLSILKYVKNILIALLAKTDKLDNSDNTKGGKS